MLKIEVSHLKLYGYHGYYVEERILGTWYEYSVFYEGNIDSDYLMDSLDRTFNYESIVSVCREVNGSSASLIETLAIEIANRLMAIAKIGKITVQVTKFNPAFGSVNANVRCSFSVCK